MDTGSKQEVHLVPPDMAVKALTALLVVFALWGVVKIFSEIKEMRFIGSGTTATNTITVSGEGEVFAVPDLATFSVTVEEEAKDVEAAQTTATQKMNDIITYLKDAGVEEKDIKTSSYNIYPQYDWVQETCLAGQACRGGRQELRGYTVSQTLTVKVRSTDKAGELLSGVGSRGVSSVSGLSFTIDDEDALKSDARQEAIDDAEAKAKELAGQLGVSLVRIVGFSEEGGGYYPPVAYMKMESAVAMDAGLGGATPDIPTGENKIQSNVTITYEIR